MLQIGEEIARLFADRGINKIITVEASGIAPAVMAGLKMHLPVVFAKKKAPVTTGRGFTFQSYNADDFLAAIDRALALYYNEPEKWLRLAQNDMAVDSSWDVPAQKYMALFQNVCGQ